MKDKKILYDNLVEAFINYQYRLEHPMPTTKETRETKRLKYLSDPMFHAKVESLAAGVMDIIENHITGN